MVSVKTAQAPGEAPGYYHHEVRDASPQFVRNLRQSLIGCHWSYQTQLLEILEWVCSTDRQFERARKVALDLINGQERAMANIVNQTMAPTSVPSQEGGDDQAR